MSQCFYISYTECNNEWKMIPASPEVMQFTTLTINKVYRFEFSPSMHPYVSGIKYYVYVPANEETTAMMSGMELIQANIKKER
jgi:hypothetical protein